MDFKLVRPSLEFKNSFLEGLIEFREEKLAWVMDLDPIYLQDNFAAFVEAELNKKTYWTKDTPVEQSEYWAIVNGLYAGRIAIRHKLNHDLEIMGGHIGYDTRPSFRGRGIGTLMLRAALPIARELGIGRALLTVNENNPASIKIIEKNGGVLMDRKPQTDNGVFKRYYWINL